MVNHVVTGKRFNSAESNINILAEGGYYFVDKTLTIKQFLTGRPHHLILRPRRCGKSHAISLLNLASSPNGVRPATLQAPFKGTLIDGESYKDLVKEHYKAYPILHMNLKNVGGLSPNKMYRTFRNMLTDPLEFCCDQLKAQNHGDTQLYRKVCKLIDRQENWLELLESAPFIITQALHIIYGRRAIILVDEYEAPLDHALEHRYLSDASDFFGRMFTTLLKDNEHVEKSFMVGILKLAKSCWISGLNNLEVFSLNAANSRYGDSFLFTEEEVQEFLQRTKCSFQLADLKGLYGSYYAKGPDGKPISLLNPWSIHNAIAQGRLSCYWNETSSYMPIRKALWNRGPDFTDRLTKLLAGEKVELTMNDMVTYEDLENLEEKDLWGLLFYAGYLTPVLFKNGCSITSRIPNVEVRREWVVWLREFIEKKEKKNFKDIKKLLDSLRQGDAMGAQKALSKILLDHLSYFSFDTSFPQKVYHLFLFGLLLSDFGGIPGSYVVDMEKEAGYGRYDIRCWPTHKDHPVEIIIELKAVSLSKKNKNQNRVMKTKEELERHMDQQLKIAMDQLNDRQYYRKSQNYVTTVHEFGICFAGKLCIVGSRTRTRDETDWTVEGDTFPGAQFQEGDVTMQEFNAIEEEQLEEEEERLGNHGERDGGVDSTSDSSFHDAAMESESTGATSPR